MDNLTVSFEGGLAESNRLPAYAASQSIYGISRSLLVVTNYLSEGRVRRRDFDERKQGFQINLIAQQAGSFHFIYEILADPTMQTIAHAVEGKIAGDLALAFIKSVFRRCVGDKAEDSIERLEAEGSLNSGDIGALVEAIEPAMKAAHSSINHGATTIILISGDNNIVNLDATTKNYVYSSVRDDTLQEKLFSIASFNANQFTGRAFDYDRGLTVPFDLIKGADRLTIEALMRSMSAYALRTSEADHTDTKIAIRYTSTIAADGRIKKMHIQKARKELLELR
jgi:hypothetical protein